MELVLKTKNNIPQYLANEMDIKRFLTFMIIVLNGSINQHYRMGATHQIKEKNGYTRRK